MGSSGRRRSRRRPSRIQRCAHRSEPAVECACRALRRDNRWRRGGRGLKATLVGPAFSARVARDQEAASGCAFSSWWATSMTAERTCSWMSSQTPSANWTSPVSSLTLKWFACSSKLLVSELSSDRTSTSPMKSSVRLSTWILSQSDLPGVRATLTGPRGLRASARPPGVLGALSRVQHRLAQPYPGGRDLDALVLAQELEGLIERELAMGHEPHK